MWRSAKLYVASSAALILWTVEAPSPENFAMLQTD